MADEAKQGGKSQLLIVALIALNTVALGLGGYYMLTKDDQAATPAQQAVAPAVPGAEVPAGQGVQPQAQAQVPAPAEEEYPEEPPAEGEEGKPVGPNLVDLESFLVNLDEPGVNRYLKVNLQVETRRKSDAGKLEDYKVQLRDEILTYMSSLNLDQTQGIVNKEIIRGNIRNRINRLLKSDVIKGVYFTEFVIQ